MSLKKYKNIHCQLNIQSNHLNGAQKSMITDCLRIPEYSCFETASHQVESGVKGKEPFLHYCAFPKTLFISVTVCSQADSEGCCCFSKVQTRPGDSFIHSTEEMSEEQDIQHLPPSMSYFTMGRKSETHVSTGVKK